MSASVASVARQCFGRHNYCKNESSYHLGPAGTATRRRANLVSHEPASRMAPWRELKAADATAARSSRSPTDLLQQRVCELVRRGGLLQLPPHTSLPSRPRPLQAVGARRRKSTPATRSLVLYSLAPKAGAQHPWQQHLHRHLDRAAPRNKVICQSRLTHHRDHVSGTECLHVTFK